MRQGCTLSPSIFNLYVQEAENKVREEIEVGIRINSERIDMLRFVDDIAVMTDNEDLQNILEILNLTMKNEYNMRINKAKTKVLVCSHNEGTQTQIALDGDTLEQVNEYKYLGRMITEDGRSTREIINKIN